MILSFVQPYVSLSEGWKRRWARVLLAGSVILPVCVLFELSKMRADSQALIGVPASPRRLGVTPLTLEEAVQPDMPRVAP